MASSSDNFKKMFMPEHPHLRLHILLSVLGFMIVFGSITFYKMNKVDVSKSVEVAQVRLSEEAQRNQVMQNLQVEAAKSPPMSEEQRKKVLENIKESL